MPSSDTEYFRYLPVSDHDAAWGVCVTGVGRTCVPPFSPTYPISVHPEHYQFHWKKGRVLQEYQSLYVLRGDGEFESKTLRNRKVLPGSLMLLFPGEWHRYRPRRAVGWDEYWISFRGRHIDELVERGFLGVDQAVLHTGVDDAILRPYLATIDHVQAEPLGYQQIIAVNVLAILAAALAAVRRQRSSTRADEVVREAKTFLEQHAADAVRMDRLAARFQWSEKHFRRIFKMHTGLSPYQYYLQLRIHRAQQMLLGTTLSIKEIAAALRFETPFHFSNVFKKKTGVAPSRWRSGGADRSSS